MGPSNSFLSFGVVFHFHDYGRKGISLPISSTSKGFVARSGLMLKLHKSQVSWMRWTYHANQKGQRYLVSKKQGVVMVTLKQNNEFVIHNLFVFINC